MKVRFYAVVMGKLVRPEDAVKGSQDGYDVFTAESLLRGPLTSVIFNQPLSRKGNNNPVNMIVAGVPTLSDLTVMVWFCEGSEPDYDTVLWAVEDHFAHSKAV